MERDFRKLDAELISIGIAGEAAPRIIEETYGIRRFFVRRMAQLMHRWRVGLEKAGLDQPITKGQKREII